MILRHKYLLPILPILPIHIARKLLLSLIDNKSHYQVLDKRKIFVDVSVIMKNDAGTGIQRTVKGILSELLKFKTEQYDIFPIYATKKYSYRYVSKLSFCDMDFKSSNSEFVQVRKGDIFLGLDLSAHVLHQHKVMLMNWKVKGVVFHILMYDLLPLSHPYFFSEKAVLNYRNWIQTVSLLANTVICISNTTKIRYREWLQEKQFNIKDIPAMEVIPMGANIKSRENIITLDPSDIKFFERITVLMVGTIEPRKGHREVLEAFKKIWTENHNINLVFIGKGGWRTDELQVEMHDLMKKEANFKWYFDADDLFVESAYQKSSGVIVASIDEGFGLPIIEATYYEKPVLARDISVFREISGDNVSFFKSSNSQILSEQIISWILKIDKKTDFNCTHYTWKDSALAVLKIIN